MQEKPCPGQLQYKTASSLCVLCDFVSGHEWFRVHIYLFAQWITICQPIGCVAEQNRNEMLISLSQ
jgi:hypothetical protein